VCALKTKGSCAVGLRQTTLSGPVKNRQFYTLLSLLRNLEKHIPCLGYGIFGTTPPPRALRVFIGGRRIPAPEKAATRENSQSEVKKEKQRPGLSFRRKRRAAAIVCGLGPDL
jgi:hypothetical protein